MTVVDDWRSKMNNQSILLSNAGPKTQKKVTQSLNITINNTQLQQQTFKWWDGFQMRQYHGRYDYFPFFISLN
jgi:hypothetical protein